MKNGQVIKSADSVDLMKEMELVNQYSRRQLSADEEYLFTVALCDNDVDRDYERFTVESLFALEKLFVGKTGIIDHDPTARNQKARIISCKVESVDGMCTSRGDQLFRLTARAYIRRTGGSGERGGAAADQHLYAPQLERGRGLCVLGHTLRQRR